MIEATGISPDSSCVACWNEKYPTRITSEAETMWERDHEAEADYAAIRSGTFSNPKE